ncbi:HSP20-like chaperone [Coccomyxa subellipsoidea C-169]|uniref:HSP20-like chaperone n=1 Tax=Coccomyxa subellipsoidea (strain C-169) TaxID=574566 RepID=I0YYT4_COCSC|nr:HSP20-like chaperone [Coccomyxa subellipsoidea C-169]EIE23553.1 HSP20-like chaperone [Coccomyxa subellipsoidea C-169]|eukprot:XP_005648097.1 HSP20-like chaperone [Coccomyxa subellipsoidea C-169]
MAQQADGGEARGDRPRTIPIDVKETQKTFIVAADIPGIPKDKVKVNIDNGLLAIVVDKSVLDAKEGNQQEKDQERMLRKERSQNYEPRSVRLPPSANLQKAKAEFIDGSLLIIIPKVEKARERKIDVQ